MVKCYHLTKSSASSLIDIFFIEKKLAQSLNYMFHYIDDVLSLNNSRFGDFVDRIYPIELEIKDTNGN